MMNPAGISFGTEPKKGRQKVARPSEVLFLERVDSWFVDIEHPVRISETDTKN